MGLLEGRVAVVTGAGHGLGREYALALAAQGASLVVNDVGSAVNGEGESDTAAHAVVAEILDHGGTAHANTSSVAEWTGAQSVINDAISQFGRLDIVVNNAGINRPSSLVNLTECDVDSQLAVHVKGTLAVSHFAAEHWSTVGPATCRAVINTTSSVGLHPGAGGGVYEAAKAGIAALTVSHAQELARYGVRVNAVAPCARTRMVEHSPAVLALMPETEGFDRHAPEHVAPLVVYLASSLCHFTGRVFAIEGPDVALYRPAGVSQHWSMEGQWTAEQLADVFADIDSRVFVDAFFPGGVTSHGIPSSRTLRMLAEMPSERGGFPPPE